MDVSNLGIVAAVGFVDWLWFLFYPEVGVQINCTIIPWFITLTLGGGATMFMDLANYFGTNASKYVQYVSEHVSLSLSALVIAMLIGLPLGYFGYRFKRVGNLFLTGSQALRVIPSLAVLFILIPIVGTGKLPATIALVFLAVPPIAINTQVGFSEVPAVTIETATGLGMNSRQLFRKIQIPLSLPYLLNGIKLALVEIIASATLATYIGAGGLGTLIFTGLGLYRLDLLLIGGLSVAILSLFATVLFDYLIRRSDI